MTMATQIAVSSLISSVPRLSPSKCVADRRLELRSSISTTKAQLSNQRSRRNGNGNGIGKRKLNFSWMATVGENVKPATPVTPTSVPVRVAHELHQAGHRYLDVRTPEEFSAGHAVGAINIPYMFRLGSGMTKNPDFVEEVLSHFGKDDEIIVGCQLGKRSLMAAMDLLSAGFTGVMDIAGGYAAWNKNGLPIES
ncbi:thiosulfate sulfurtransferase 16, chloroplastic-like [Cynara cardunculus var. scolymus]|uniref:thiosulfate sulfurtransferase 16, chloroplastic-like n=1 Tax=Cynara cardunculus var. scolymus TaxID=59895 RepID=UPI000D6298CD|nr:thiosulfate sulfurtransferase 16, chloroplastic-like [Cynara cardunculus var. scolymus]